MENKKRIFGVICALFGLSNMGLASDMRPREEYLILKEEEVSKFQDLGVSPGVYLASLSRDALRRTDLNEPRGGGVIKPVGTEDDEIVIGFAPGTVAGTRGEVWAIQGGRRFLLKEASGKSTVWVRGVPAEIFPALNGAFFLSKSGKIAFIEDDFKGKVRTFDSPGVKDNRLVYLTKSGRSIVYMTDENQVALLTHDGKVASVARFKKDEPTDSSVIVSGDGVLFQSTPTTVSLIEIGDDEVVYPPKVVFDARQGEQVVFVDGKVVVTSVKSTGGNASDYLLPNGLLASAAASTRLLAPSADEVRVLQTFGENWTTRVRSGAFRDLSVQEDKLEEIVRGLTEAKNTWINIQAPYLGGGDDLAKAVAVRLNELRLKSENWRDWIVVAMGGSSVVSMDAAEKAVEAANSKNQNSKLVGPLTKTLNALKNRKVVLVIENLLDDPELGPTNAQNVLDVFLKTYRAHFAKGEVRVITISRTNLWRKLAEGNPELENMGSQIKITPPNLMELEQLITTKLKSETEGRNVSFEGDLAKAIIQIAQQLEPGNPEPARSLGIVAKLSRHFGSPDSSGRLRVVSLLEARSYLVSQLLQKTSLKNIDLDGLKEHLNKRLIGQTEAKSKIVDEIATLRVGLVDINRPLLNLFFIGPTGVGKSMTANLLAEYLRWPLIRIDMTGFKGFEANSLEAKRIKEQEGRPYILLLDDAHKAGKAAFNSLRSIFESGIYAENTENQITFRNAIVVVTSNHAAKVIYDAGDQPLPTLLKQVKAFIFDPKTEEKEQIDKDVWSRLEGSVAVFRRLSENDLTIIAEKALADWLKTYQSNNSELSVNVDQRFVEFIVTTTFEDGLGATPVKHRVESILRAEIAKHLAARDAAKVVGIKKLYITVNNAGKIVVIDDKDPDFSKLVPTK